MSSAEFQSDREPSATELRSYVDLLTELWETDPERADQMLRAIGRMSMDFAWEDYYENFNSEVDGLT